MIDDSIFILYYIHSYTIIESLDKSMAAKISPLPMFSELQAMLRWPDDPVGPGLPRNYLTLRSEFPNHLSLFLHDSMAISGTDLLEVPTI